MTHALERTSPLGQPFQGRCAKCGQEGFYAADALEPCPMDDMVSDDFALTVLMREQKLDEEEQ